MAHPKYKRKPKQFTGPPPAVKPDVPRAFRPLPNAAPLSGIQPAAPAGVAKPLVLPVATWGESAAHRLLLTKFLTLKSADDFTVDDLWQSVLKEPPGQVIRQFMEAGAIRAAGAAELLDYKFKAGELRRQLQARQCSETGSKAQLIERLISADPAWVQQATAGMAVYTCSDGGRALAESYLEQDKQARAAAHQQVLAALDQQAYEDAARAVYAFEAAQVFPRGIDVDWSHHDTTLDESALQAIFSYPLKDLSADQLQQVRQNAGVRWLFSYSYDDYPLPSALSDELLDDGFRLTGALISNAHYHTVIKACKKSQALLPQVKHEVIYSTCSDHLVCEECRRLAERVWTPDEAPELPYAKCNSDSESGCRCSVTWRVEAR